MTGPNEELSRAEREALAGLAREASPPAALEDRTVGALRERGLLRPARRRRQVSHPVLALAASILVFLAGYGLGRAPRPTSPEPSGAQFVLLLYEGPGYREAPPGREAERVQEYSTWAGARARRGELVAGEKLRDEGDMVIRNDGSVATVPAAPGGTRLAGFFIIRAPGRQAALEIARSCPHVRHGGSIVIREIEPTS